jgi:hypothetical protein
MVKMSESEEEEGERERERERKWEMAHALRAGGTETVEYRSGESERVHD